MVEIEIGVLFAANASTATLKAAISSSGEDRRNASGARVNWMFSTEQARINFARAYPKPWVKESKSL